MSVSVLTPSFDAPIGVTRTPTEGSLVHRMATGEATAALTFAGQGWRWWDDLGELLARRSWLRPRAEAWARIVADLTAAPSLRERGGAPSGFHPLAWLDADRRPSAGELCSLPVSLPGVLLTQLLAYREAWEDGLHAAVDAGSVVSATGHSGGLLAAAAVAARPDGLDDIDAVAPLLHLAVLIGHLAGTCELAVAPGRLEDALSGEEGAATPMVAVSGVRLDRLAALLDERAAETGVRIALRHGPTRAVLAGTPEALRTVQRVILAAADEDPGVDVPHWEPLAASAPFHHPVMASVRDEVVSLARTSGLTLPRPDRGITLVSPAGPEPLSEGDLIDQICTALLVQPGHWDRTVASICCGGAGVRAADHVLDLGPSDGVARLVAAAARGTGAQVLALATSDGRRDLVVPGAEPEPTVDAYTGFGPDLVVLPDGTTHVENRFTRATGRAPIVLAGMTPTTVDAPIVAAAANAGFLAELAGGGQVSEAILAERLDELAELLEPGQEIVFNALHLDPYLWGLHLGRHRLVQQARAAGAPIAGVTVSAGIPPVDDAVALLDELAGLGMWCNAFKPGTVDQVRRVVDIAHAAPQHTVFVHLEGGSAGGHHSWVDLDDLLLGSYHLLRACPNVVVCVGGGIGTPERAAGYLTGEWSLAHTPLAMPVDGVLIGTAAMAAAEATATPSVKQALRDAVPGAVTSGRSGLDADIHFLDNSASRCAALLDQVAGDEAAVAERRDEIVVALDRTAKPYFGDVADMTYEQWLRRFVELTALGRHGRYEDGAWLDHSHRSRFVELLQRTEARLDPAEVGEVPTAFADPSSVDDPAAALDLLLRSHPAAADTRLHPADPGFFLAVCRRAGKPVPFVPVLDSDVRRWYQSDSLWQAQHPDYDADAVLIIPGPAAVDGIASADEPVADLLGRFETHLVERLGRTTEVRGVDRRARHGATERWTGPAAALFEVPTVVIDGRIVSNPVWTFDPVDRWDVEVLDGRLTSATLLMGDESVRVEAGDLDSGGGDDVTLTVSWPGLTGGVERSESLSTRFRRERRPGCDVLVSGPDRVSTLRHLLEEHLIGGALRSVPLGENAVLRTHVDGRRAAAHARLLGAAGEHLPDGWLATVWPAVFAVLGADELVGSLLDLVHLEHAVDARRIAADLDGCEVTVTARVVAVADHEAGTRVDTIAEVVHDGTAEPTVTVRGGFLLRGRRGLASTVSRLPGLAAVPDDERVQDRPPFTFGRVERRAPDSMAPFAAVSGDRNPIHRSDVLARLVGLDGAIVHGAWTSALAQHAVIELAGAGESRRLAGWDARFLAPLLPGEDVAVTVTRSGVVGARTVVEATATVQRPEGSVPVLSARAEVLPPRTAYLFPGQGIQRDGMGMDGYERSAAARDVWDRADAHTREVLGFSILSIVRENPTVISVALPGGGAEVHRHPAGVLHLTQFTQVAMAALALAQVAELREQEVFDEGAVCAGHSVGEYNALASIGDVLPLEVVVELVFRRGQSMHHLVPRDADGRSDFRLGVVRPHQVDLDHAGVESAVDEVGEQTGELLEIVNYNLRGKQYAVAGTVRSLDALDRALDRLRGSGSKDPFLYVPGIDVPFHSSALRDGVQEFRSHLDAGLPERIDPGLLVGRYVPNLVPRPFSLQRSFVQEVCDHVGSEVLTEILADWPRRQADPSRLCRELLIELLAWQFASPVRWIETQDLLFAPVTAGGLGVTRVIEVGLGSAPTVANLARGTLALGDRPAGEVRVLNVEADRIEVFALDEDPLEEPEAIEEPADAPAAPTPAAPAPAASAPIASAPVAAAPVGQVDDLPVSAADALRILLALLTKVRVDQLADGESIDDLVDGVSSRRNQLLMDLGAEFSIAGVDGARELPLDRLASELTDRAGRYRFPGPVLRDARDAALSTVLGPRRLKQRDVVARIAEHWNLGPGWEQRVLTALALEGRDAPSARGGVLGRLSPLPVPGDAAIDAAVELVASDAGIVLPTPGASEGGAVDAAAVTELEARIAGPGGLLAEAARDLLARVDPDESEPAPLDSTSTDRLAQLDAEHGDRRATAVAPIFDAHRHVAFTSWWATARHDVVALHHACLRGDEPSEVLDAEADRLAPHVADAGVRASATWFAARAAERGDAPAAARFDRILAGAPWTPPVPAVRPGIDDTGDAVEEPAGPERLDELVATIARSASPYVPAWVDHLGARRGIGGDRRPDLSAEVALVTGASPGSIAIEVVRRLLAGGATVVCTTTDHRPERLATYRELYRTSATPGAQLHVVPANLASFADVDAVVDWMLAPVVDRSAGVARTLKDPMVPTLVVPFAAGPVVGDLAEVGAASEVAMRVLLWGVERLVGRLAEAVERAGTAGARPRVVLPLSPNHGGFGGDGAYGEAKAALEVVIEKWSSEQERWGSRVDLIAATIGWVRGTGLMDANDALAALVERDLAVRTFSPAEMGWLLTALCQPDVVVAGGHGPMRVDLSGGLDRVGPLRAAVAPLVSELDQLAAGGIDDPERTATIPALLGPVRIEQRAPVPTRRAPIRALEDMVVVVGAGELGPWGGSATRFDLELDGELEAGSIAELAWTCGLIRWDAALEGGSWVDVVSDEPVAEGDLAERYRDDVMQRCGVRTFDADGPLDPDGVTLMVEVFVDSEVVVTAADEADARAYAAADPESSRVRLSRDGDWQVVRRAGSSIRVPRRAALSRRVGAQVPTGFDPTRWGIPAEMAASVDRLALWNLVATVEAFLDAGIEPEELMARVHPARVGNTQGSGMGGMSSIQTLYRDSVLGGDHPSDLLQEGLGNVIAAYVVQSYVGSYGPMVHPVAACATAAVSIEDAVDKIRAGKADVVVAGGWDDLGLEGVLGFGEMAATAATDEMQRRGFSPHQYSRANDRRRAGFVEAQGGGTLLLARASTAAELALPVRGVVVHAASFGDGIHTSIPAPGLGALACVLGGRRSPLAVALDEHGLDPDDLAVVSKHDTSTAANDPNESELHHRIATELGRSSGNPMLVVSQKTVTGHAKGGAAAWQTIGLLQVLESGRVPGNRNLECLDESHREHTHLAYGHRDVAAGEPLRAGLLTSLGFGHVSAVLCLAAADVFLAALAVSSGDDAVQRYRAEADRRRRDGRRRRDAARYGGEPVYAKRIDRRFAGDDQDARHEAEAVLLTDPFGRLGEDGTYCGEARGAS